MSLSDIMSAAGLDSYAKIGLLISFAAFAGVVVWVLMRPREEMEARARQVLEDDADGNQSRGDGDETSTAHPPDAVENGRS